ncbi:MAG TPA: hypothetical protein VLA92_01415 [Candidatus Saccharimonadales bacterium]|nr:hypothetical protein [Candidatus Saccharimonadales bacterium]
MSHYETLISDEYWADAVAPPEVGTLAGLADRLQPAAMLAKEVRGSYYALHNIARTTALVEADEELPITEAGREGYVQLILDERVHGRAAPRHRDDVARNPEAFEARVSKMMAREYLGSSALINVVDEGSGLTISRTVLFARSTRSGKQYVGVTPRTVNSVSDDDWGKKVATEQPLVVPRYRVGQTYTDEIGGVRRDRKVAFAEHARAIKQISADDKPRGGKRTATLDWMIHQAGLAGGQA